MLRSFMLKLMLCLPAAAFGATAWPENPIRMVVPFGTGGPVDNSARLVAQKASTLLGRSIVVENKPGAGGNIGAAFVQNARPDGYTILVAGVSFVINPYVYKDISYDPLKDFAAVSVVVQYPQVMVMSPKTPVDSVQGLLEYAKLHPGKLNYGSAGVGTSGHLIVSSFLAQTGVNLTHVPYKGGSSTTMGLMRGDVDVAVDGLPSFMSPEGAASKVRILGLSTAQRWPLASELPTLAEAAKLPGFDYASWVVFLAPKGTPPEVLDKLAQAVDQAMKDPQLAQRLKDSGAMPVGGTAADAQAFVVNEAAKWRKVVELSGAKAQ